MNSFSKYALTLIVLIFCGVGFNCMPFNRQAASVSVRSGLTNVPASQALNPDSLAAYAAGTIDSGQTINQEDIDSLITAATSACQAAQYVEADSILQLAIGMIEAAKAQSDSGATTLDKNFDTLATIYARLMPSEYRDEVPDEIAMLVFQKQLSIALDTIKISPTDSTAIASLACQKGINYSVPLVWNDRVHKALRYLIGGQKGAIGKWLERSVWYMPLIRREFSDSGMPPDLGYLPMIESGFSPFAYSFAHASGMWQFIEPTGRRYGLRVNYWLDERRDPIKSTRSAISYLKKLYNQFGSWYVALAAYNCGEGNMQGAINRCNSNDYWKLSLHKETMGYVPQFIAALMISKSPSCFGFTIESTDTFDLDTISVSECLDLDAVADSLGIPVSQLHAMNPHILHWCTPPQSSKVLLYLPAGLREGFLAALEENRGAFAVKFFRYNAKQHENLTDIARRFSLSLTALRTVNPTLSERLKNGTTVLLPIPANAAPQEELTEASLPDDFGAHVRGGRSTKTIRYRVRSGDHISRLAELFHVSVRDICRWNRLKNPSRLAAGAILTLHIPESVSASRVKYKAVRQGERNVYTVAKGDNLSAIAGRLHVSVNDLLAWNNKASGEKIYQGEKLTYVPGGRSSSQKSVPAAAVRYRIVAGDNLSGIARTFSVSVDALARLNNLSGSSVLRPGDVLAIPPASSSVKSGQATARSGQKQVYYRVKRGDTLWNIASLFKTSPQSLQKVNNLGERTKLIPGDIIKIPLAEAL